VQDLHQVVGQLGAVTAKVGLKTSSDLRERMIDDRLVACCAQHPVAILVRLDEDIAELCFEGVRHIGQLCGMLDDLGRQEVRAEHSQFGKRKEAREQAPPHLEKAAIKPERSFFRQHAKLRKIPANYPRERGNERIRGEPSCKWHIEACRAKKRVCPRSTLPVPESQDTPACNEYIRGFRQIRRQKCSHHRIGRNDLTPCYIKMLRCSLGGPVRFTYRRNEEWECQRQKLFTQAEFQARKIGFRRDVECLGHEHRP